MNCVQPNVTARIKILEDMCQCKLFHRNNGANQLTDSGQIFRRYAEQLMSLKNEAINATMDVDTPIGDLRVATTESIAASRLPTVLMKFHNQFPRVKLQVERVSCNIMLERLRSGLIDAALLVGNVNDSRWETEIIGLESLMLVAPKDSDKTSKNHVISILTLEPNCPYAQQLIHQFESKGLNYQIVQLGSIDSILHGVQNGLGVTALPSSLIASRKIEEDIVVHSLEPQFAKVPIHLIRRNEDYQSRAITEFRQLLLQTEQTH